MNKKFQKKPDEDVESLAHDLLGVDFNAADDEDEPLEVDGLGLDDLGFGPTPEEQSQIEQENGLDEDQAAAIADAVLEGLKSLPGQPVEDDAIAWLVSAAKNPSQAEGSGTDNSNDSEAAASDMTDDDDGFGSGLLDDEVDFDHESDDAVEDTVDAVDDDFGDDVEDDAEAGVETEVARPASKGRSADRSERDAYWDALDEFESGSSSKKRGRGRSRGRTSPEKTSEPSQKRSRRRSSAKTESDDDATKASTPDIQQDAEQTDSSPEKKRRRRSGKSKPKTERAPRQAVEDVEAFEDVDGTATADDDFGAGILEDTRSGKKQRGRKKSVEKVEADFDTETDDESLQAPEEDRSDVDDDDFDDFGAGLDVEDDDMPAKPARRRAPQQKKVKRQSRSVPEKAPTRSVKSKSTGAEVAAKQDRRRTEPSESSDSTDSSAKTKSKKKDRFAGIPTWETAIGFLDIKRQKAGGASSSNRRGQGNRKGRGRKPSKGS